MARWQYQQFVEPLVTPLVSMWENNTVHEQVVRPRATLLTAIVASTTLAAPVYVAPKNPLDWASNTTYEQVVRSRPSFLDTNNPAPVFVPASTVPVSTTNSTEIIYRRQFQAPGLFEPVTVPVAIAPTTVDRWYNDTNYNQLVRPRTNQSHLDNFYTKGTHFLPSNLTDIDGWLPNYPDYFKSKYVQQDTNSSFVPVVAQPFIPRIDKWIPSYPDQVYKLPNNQYRQDYYESGTWLLRPGIQIDRWLPSYPDRLDPVKRIFWQDWSTADAFLSHTPTQPFVNPAAWYPTYQDQLLPARRCFWDGQDYKNPLPNVVDPSIIANIVNGSAKLTSNAQALQIYVTPTIGNTLLVIVGSQSISSVGSPVSPDTIVSSNGAAFQRDTTGGVVIGGTTSYQYVVYKYIVQQAMNSVSIFFKNTTGGLFPINAAAFVVEINAAVSPQVYMYAGGTHSDSVSRISGGGSGNTTTWNVAISQAFNLPNPPVKNLSLTFIMSVFNTISGTNIDNAVPDSMMLSTVADNVLDIEYALVGKIFNTTIPNSYNFNGNMNLGGFNFPWMAINVTYGIGAIAAWFEPVYPDKYWPCYPDRIHGLKYLDYLYRQYDSGLLNTSTWDTTAMSKWSPNYPDQIFRNKYVRQLDYNLNFFTHLIPVLSQWQPTFPERIIQKLKSNEQLGFYTVDAKDLLKLTIAEWNTLYPDYFPPRKRIGNFELSAIVPGLFEIPYIDNFNTYIRRYLIDPLRQPSNNFTPPGTTIPTTDLIQYLRSYLNDPSED
jgi:hypothetical protein